MPLYATGMLLSEEIECAMSGVQRDVAMLSHGVHEAGEEGTSSHIAVHYNNYARKATTKEATLGARERP